MAGTKQGPIPVLLVDGVDGTICEALSQERSFAVRRVESFTEALAVIAQTPPQAVVAVLGEATAEEVSAFRKFRRVTATLTLLITDPVGERRVAELIKAGAGGYLFSTEIHKVTSAVQELIRGGVPMSDAVSRIVLGRARRSSVQMAAVSPAVQAPETPLTGRQRDILELLSNGHSYEAIGVALDLSVNTVRSHVRALYKRLGASTKVEAVMIARHLLDQPPVSR